MASEEADRVRSEDVLASVEGSTKTAAREPPTMERAPLTESGALLQAHPAAEFFPPISDEQYATFKADIAANGLREDIWLYEGRILDGRNRYRACMELGITPRFRTYSGDSPTAFAWSLNGERRHLSNGQRAAIGVEMLPALREEAKQRQLAGLKRGLVIPVPPTVGERASKKQEAVEAAAQIVKASATNIQYAKAVQERAPEIFQQLKRGELNVFTAYRRAQGKPAQAPSAQRLPRDVRLADIRRLAAEGNRAMQIGKAIGLSSHRVSELAHKAGIALPDAISGIGKSRHLNARRAIEGTVSTLEGLALGLREIEGLLIEAAPDEAKDWAQSIEASLRPIKALKRTLKRMAIA